MLRFTILLFLICGAVEFSFAAGQTRYSGGNMQLNTGSWENFESKANSGTCSTAGAVQYDSGNGWLEWCNGSKWRKADGGTNQGSCSGAGKTRYNSSRLQFCNGSQWRQAAPVAALASCTTSQGFTVSSGTTNSYYSVSSAGSCGLCDTYYRSCTCNDGVWSCAGGTYTTCMGGGELCA